MAQVKRVDDESPKPPAKRQRSTGSSNGSSKASNKPKTAKKRTNTTVNGKLKAKSKKKPIEEEEEEVDEEVASVDSEDDDFKPSSTKKQKVVKNQSSRGTRTVTTKKKAVKKKSEVDLEEEESEEDEGDNMSDDELFEEETKTPTPKGKKATKGKGTAAAKGKTGKASTATKGKNTTAAGQTKSKPKSAGTKAKPKVKSKAESTPADKKNKKGSVPSWKPVLCATGLESFQWDMLEGLAKRKNSSLKSEFDSKTTHMILRVMKPDDAPTRTMKLCKAVAAGITIVCFDWIQESIEASGAWPDVAPHIHKLSRAQNEPGLFEGKEFFFGPLGDQAKHKDDLTEIVRLGGGKVLWKRPSFPAANEDSDNTEPPSTNLVLVEDPALSEQRAGRRASLIELQQAIPGSELVAPTWILDQCCPASRKEKKSAKKKEKEVSEEENNDDDGDSGYETEEPVTVSKLKPKKKAAPAKATKAKAARNAKNPKTTKGAKGKAANSKSDKDDDVDHDAGKSEGKTVAASKPKQTRGLRGGKRTTKAKAPTSGEGSGVDVDGDKASEGKTSPTKPKAAATTRGGKRSPSTKEVKEDVKDDGVVEAEIESDKFMTPPRSDGKTEKVDESANSKVGEEDVEMKDVEEKIPSNKIEVEATPETEEDLAEKNDLAVPLDG